MEVTVIDDSDYVGWTAAATRIGEIYMTSVVTMVANVLGLIGSRKMGRLNVLDHGNSRGMQVGTDWVSAASLPTFDPQLRRLRGHFSSKGFVHLQHCNVGNARTLLVGLARIWNVSVYAGTGAHNPVYRINLGSYVRADPSGAYTVGVGRP